MREAGMKTAWLDAEVLLCHVLGVGKAQMYANSHAEVSGGEMERFRGCLKRRMAHEPVAYITGEKEFWSLDFFINSAVLIPRPETELLVEVAVKLMENRRDAALVKVLDIGTGCGALAISLARELASARIWAVDVSAAALEVARKNCARHGVDKRIHLLQGDLFEPVAGLRFDLILSNPPYIRSSELSNLAEEIRLWEPIGALDGGVDGLNFYREMVRDAHNYLNPKGHMALEIGAEMGDAVAALIDSVGQYGSLSIKQDYAGKDRVIIAANAALGEPVKRGWTHG